MLETGPWDGFTGEDAWVGFRGDWGNQKKMVNIVTGSTFNISLIPSLSSNKIKYKKYDIQN